MFYEVKIQYSRGPATKIAEFKAIEDARLFINDKLHEDARVRVDASYQICEGMDVVEEFKQGDQQGSATGGQSDNGEGQGGAQQKTSFKPTPFNVSPRPPGMPPNWLKDEDEADDTEDK